MQASTLEAYHAVRERAGLIDEPLWGAVEVRGADRAGFLHNLLTQDVTSLAPGTAVEAALVTPAAKLLADLVVLAEPQAHWLIAPRGRVEAVMQTLDRYLITEDVRLADRRGSHEVLALQGPRSAEILKALGGGVRQAAHSCTGEAGALLIAPVEQAPALRRQCGERDAAAVGWDAVNVLRIEAGIPWYGIDMDESNLLPETGLERTHASDTKGCYVGQEVIARLRTYGSASRKLMGLLVDGRDIPCAGDPIEKGGETLGAITSACWSPALQRPIALGYVKRPHYEAGAAVTVRHGRAAMPAALHVPPFVSPRARSTPSPAGG